MKIYHWIGNFGNDVWRFNYPNWLREPPEAEEYELELPEGFEPIGGGGDELIAGAGQVWSLLYRVEYRPAGAWRERWIFSLRSEDPSTKDIPLGSIVIR